MALPQHSLTDTHKHTYSTQTHTEKNITFEEDTQDTQYSWIYNTHRHTHLYSLVDSSDVPPKIDKTAVCLKVWTFWLLTLPEWIHLQSHHLLCSCLYFDFQYICVKIIIFFINQTCIQSLFLSFSLTLQLSAPPSLFHLAHPGDTRRSSCCRAEVRCWVFQEVPQSKYCFISKKLCQGKITFEPGPCAA